MLQFTLLLLITSLSLMPAWLAQAQPEQELTEEQFLSAVQILTDGSDTTIEADLETLEYLEQQALYFDDAARRKLNRIKCWYLHHLEPAQVNVFTETQIAEAQQAQDRVAEADFINCQAAYDFYFGDPDKALGKIEQAYAIAQQINDRRLIADMMAARGEINSYRGDLAIALRDLLRAQSIYDALDLPYYSAYNLSIIANTYRRMKAYGDALEHYARLHELYSDALNRASLMEIKLYQSIIYQDMGQLDTAQQLAKSVYDFYQQQEDPDGISFASTYLGSIHNDMGDYQTGLVYIRQSIALSDNPDLDPQLNQFYLGQALNGLNELDQASVALANAEASFKRENNLRFLSLLHQEKALLYAKQKLWQQAFDEQKRYTDSLVELTEKQDEQHSARLRIEFNLQRTQDENDHLKQQQALKNAELQALAEASKWQFVTVALASALLVVIAIAGVRLWLHARRMQRLALTDPLTMLPNRRHIEEVGLQMLDKCVQNKHDCSLLVMDIDHFKTINDSYGHEVGDQVLKILAQTAKAAIRHQDVIGRTGGEEFIALMPQTSSKQASLVAERIRRDIDNLDLSYLATTLSVTTSIGVAQHNASHESLNELTCRADQALYQAKEQGRNRVVVADR
ncbi:GGDEF domain-containing protein [Neiella marina]|uniref:diguanylate cyclase n=1 Tax=Neiella marina TaxID=508461 RepID=A0A8J2U619_9GAMM|nr:GGDEF domain-containing protein [Neiella marina]GGA81043.1 GGDEF domain-containing protein [Neiella marina]